MRLLIVGKTDGQISLASKIAQSHGANVTHSENIEGALNLLRSGKGADLVLVDVLLDVSSLVNSLKQERIHATVACYGIESNSEDVVKAIKAGAKEYIPFPPDENMIAAVLEAISEESSSIIYASDSMKELVELADRIAPSDANVLITGESGTGKEVFARYIHNKSNRSKDSFVPVNCAAIPDNLLESELFGHEKGAFTGASHKRVGKFEESNNGTLLLDEISEMDVRLQAKLLRAIQEKEIDRIGGTQSVQLNLRVLATSNRDLAKEVREGNFREDLLFRLNVIELKIPPLRERKEDIKIFAEYFVEKYSENNDLPVLDISEAAMKKLVGYSWPGNVRELENVIHRAVLLNNGKEIDEKSIVVNSQSTGSDDEKKEGATEGDGSVDSLVGKTVEAVEHDLILSTLDHCLGNRTHAANILGISIRTLRNKLKSYDEQGSE